MRASLLGDGAAAARSGDDGEQHEQREGGHEHDRDRPACH
jgi:hypothetical protein